MFQFFSYGGPKGPCGSGKFFAVVFWGHSPQLTRYRAGVLCIAVAASRLQPQPILQALQQLRVLSGLPSVLHRAGDLAEGYRFVPVPQGWGFWVALTGRATSNQWQAQSGLEPLVSGRWAGGCR